MEDLGLCVHSLSQLTGTTVEARCDSHWGRRSRLSRPEPCTLATTAGDVNYGNNVNRCRNYVVRRDEETTVEVPASSLSPQKYESCDEPESTAAGMEKPPLPNHAARFGGGRLRRRVHEMTIGRHDKEDRVGPICEQDQGPEQPAPFEGAEKRDEPPTTARLACIM